MKSRFIDEIEIRAIARRRSRQAGAAAPVRRSCERSEARIERTGAEQPAGAPQARQSLVMRLNLRLNRLSFLIQGLDGSDTKNRQNRVLSLFDGQQEISDSPRSGFVFRILGVAAFSVAGYTVTLRGYRCSPPIRPLPRPGFRGWRETFAFLFLASFFNNLLFFKS